MLNKFASTPVSNALLAAGKRLTGVQETSPGNGQTLLFSIAGTSDTYLMQLLLRKGSILNSED